MAQDVHSAQADARERLKSEVIGLVGALGDRAVASLRDRVQDTAGRLADFSDGGGNGGGASLMAALTGAKGMAEGKTPLRAMAGAGMAGLKEKVTGMFQGSGGGGKGGKGGKGKGMKVTNIIEQIDVGAPISLTYNLWTQFSDYPSFMKKVESVEQEEDEKLSWRAQILWSHRNWQATILEQVPDEKIIWRSEGAKGYVDGAVTFHELAPRLTRIIMVLEYHPQGFFEHTGNLWRAQGRRARLELKHFRRHLMSEVLLHPEEVEGWRGEIHEGQVVDQEDGEGDASEQADMDQQDADVEKETRPRRASRADSDEDEQEPDGGERGDRSGRRDGTDRLARAGRTERQRRGSSPESGSAERARRPTRESRRPVPRQRARSERAGGEGLGRPNDARRSAK
jgi:uncharacterized membrane protein